MLLLIENTSSHPLDLQHENDQIIFFPKNTISLLQPLHQGIILTFKVLYIRQIFTYILEQIKNNEYLTLINSWNNFYNSRLI